MLLNGGFKIAYNSLGKRSVDSVYGKKTIVIPYVVERKVQNSL